MPNSDKDVATLKEIAVFWTEILRDSGSDLKDRLKVSELLSRFSSELSSGNETDTYHAMSLDECYEYISKLMDSTEGH